MSNLRKKNINRLIEKRARQLLRLEISLDWQVQPILPLLNQRTRRVANNAWLGARKANVAVMLVSPEESRELNMHWRHKDYATNVLSFPFEFPDGIEKDTMFLGDLVICVDVLEREAQEQDKSLSEHFAHLLVHGLLHLQGYDHETDAEAEEMELLETQLLEAVGLKNPYQ